MRPSHGSQMAHLIHLIQLNLRLAVKTELVYG
jgi:hypothetical protein